MAVGFHESTSPRLRAFCFLGFITTPLQARGRKFTLCWSANKKGAYMTGQEVHAVLTARGITALHHANSVKTSSSLIRLGGLASRGNVEAAHLPQTWQYSDPDDKKYGIWNDVFLDAPDFHHRIANCNQYGPVTFEVSIDILLSLPPGSRVLVAKLNPTKWDGVPEEGRYFLTPAELQAGFSFGDFDHMLIIRTASGIVPFGNHLRQILVDEPLQPNPSKQYGEAAAHLNATLAASHSPAAVTRRTCRADCKCTATYAKQWGKYGPLFELPN